MDQQQIRGIADRFIDALHGVEDGDASSAQRIAELFAEDAQLSNSIMAHQQGTHQYSGREHIANFWRAYRESFQDIHSEFDEITLNDQAAGLFWRSSGADKQGRPLNYEGVSLLELNDAGQIQRFKAYFDSRQVAGASNSTH